MQTKLQEINWEISSTTDK